MINYQFISNKLMVFVIFLLCVMLMPLLYIFLNFIDNPFYFPQYLQKPLIIAFINGFLLSVVTCLFSLLWAVPAALVLNLFNVKFKKIWASFLMLPIAIPSYLSAYVYSDLFYYSGTFAKWYFKLTGDLIPFNMHSLIGAGFILSLSLYPYVFFPLYMRLRNFSGHIFDYALTIGHGKYSIIYVMLKSAMPVMLFGLGLITLETLNDYGTVSHYGVKVPSLFLFDIWQQTGNMDIAIKITCIFLLLTGGIFYFSYKYQFKRNYDNSNVQKNNTQFKIKNNLYIYLIYGWLLFILSFMLLLPIGFFLYHFMAQKLLLENDIYQLAVNSFIPALSVGLLCACVALIFSYYHYHSRNKYLKSVIILCTSGYTFPSIILAISVYGLLLSLNRNYNLFWGEHVSIVSSSIIGLILCYFMKFLTVFYNCLSPIYKTISASFFQSAITVGYSYTKAGYYAYWSFLKKPLGVGFILVLVDVIKELPITLLMRPFGFETFATYTYNMASLERIEEASTAALILIFMGIIAALIPIFSHIIKDSNYENF